MDKGFCLDSLCHRHLLSTDDRPCSGVLSHHTTYPSYDPKRCTPFNYSAITTERLRRDIRQHHARIGVSCARRGNARTMPSSCVRDSGETACPGNDNLTIQPSRCGRATPILCP